MTRLHNRRSPWATAMSLWASVVALGVACSPGGIEELPDDEAGGQGGGGRPSSNGGFGNAPSLGGRSGGFGGSRSGGGSPGIGGSGGSSLSNGGRSGIAGGPTVAGDCAGLGYQENSSGADRFTWSDALCKERSADMARVGGGYVRSFTYDFNGQPRVAAGSGSGYGVGWGYAVSHDLPQSSVEGASGEYGAGFVGTHHAFYEYRFDWPGTSIHMTMTWFFATGRSNPVLAITYDLSDASPNQYEGDYRTPYGDIAFNGRENANQPISGVGWGDRYKFVTTSAPLTMDSSWDYTEPNLVPYAMEWVNESDAEMGAVQTQTWDQHDAGGYWFYENWGKTSDNQVRGDGQAGEMPLTWNWTYQLNQYQLCEDQSNCVRDTTSSHRLAWGANYGAVGQQQYNAYGDDRQLNGYPYQSYSVFMVLGKHSEDAVLGQVREIETVQKTKLSASVGTVPAQGPGGTNRTDLVPLEPAGYDHRFSVWIVEAENDAVTLDVDVDGTLENPVLMVRNYSGASPSISLDGAELVADEHYSASLDEANQRLFITFRTHWTGSQRVVIR